MPVKGNTKEIQTGTEKILFVDDENELLDIYRTTLERIGYTVDIYDRSLMALESIRSDPQKYDLVITDQTMPKMTGAELAKEIIRIRPDLPIILCTGFSESISPEKAFNIGIKAFLMKPLLLSELAQTIRSILDGGRKK